MQLAPTCSISLFEKFTSVQVRIIETSLCKLKNSNKLNKNKLTPTKWWLTTTFNSLWNLTTLVSFTFDMLVFCFAVPPFSFLFCLTYLHPQTSCFKISWLNTIYNINCNVMIGLFVIEKISPTSSKKNLVSHFSSKPTMSVHSHNTNTFYVIR